MDNNLTELIRKSIIDAIQTYVDNVSDKLPFDKTLIGIVLGNGTREGNKVQVADRIYDNVLSIGNTIYATNSTVKVCIPSNQNNNIYIVGSLSKSLGGGVTVDDFLSTTSINPVQNKIITQALNELFQSVSNGKILIASAITDKGVPTEATDTFATMAGNIREIPSGEYEFPTDVLVFNENFYVGYTKGTIINTYTKSIVEIERI